MGAEVMLTVLYYCTCAKFGRRGLRQMQIRMYVMGELAGERVWG